MNWTLFKLQKGCSVGFPSTALHLNKKYLALAPNKESMSFHVFIAPGGEM